MNIEAREPSRPVSWLGTPLGTPLMILLVALALFPSVAASIGLDRVDVLPFPATPDDPLTVVATGSTAACSGDPVLTEIFRSSSLVMVELLDPGCPLLPPGPHPFRTAVTIDPLAAGDYRLEIRDPSGHVLSTRSFSVGAAPLTARVSPRRATAIDRVRLRIQGRGGGCSSILEAVEIEAAGELSRASAAVSAVCLLDPPSDDPFDYQVDLGRLPAGKYLVEVDQELLGLSAGDYFEVAHSNTLPVFTIPELPTNRDTVFTLVINLPGRQICQPLKRVLLSTQVTVEVDESCITMAPPGALTTISAELGPLAAGRYPVVVLGELAAELLRDEIEIAEGGSCEPSETALCLSGGRFRVDALRVTQDGVLGPGHARQLTRDSGSFWFFDSDNVELDVKVLDGCGINNHYWVFAAGLTNVEVQIKVTDTANGRVRGYINSQGEAFKPVQDIDDFQCP